MIGIEQQRNWAQQLVAASAAELTAVQPDWMSAARAAAVQTLSTLPLLDRKQEAWRYTFRGIVVGQEAQGIAAAGAQAR